MKRCTPLWNNRLTLVKFACSILFANAAFHTPYSAFKGQQHNGKALRLSAPSIVPDEQQFLNDEHGERGDVMIPSTGVSVNDEMVASQKDRFVSEVVPIKTLSGVFQIVTTVMAKGSVEPVRYLVRIDESTFQFALIDIPPYSDSLATRLKSAMGGNGTLAAIFVTSRDGIHYDDAPAVYSMRRSDLMMWRQVFPGLQVVAYRLDIPRDCREDVTVVLDGYGPFAMDTGSDGGSNTNLTFVETGRPLTVVEWDHDVAQQVLSGNLPPDDKEYTETNLKDESQDMYSPENIRAREEDKQVLAIYTPGHSFGSLSYVFPKTGLLFSGFSIPIEDTRSDLNMGIEATGPMLDCRGYITTSRAGVVKQMQSARQLIRTYADRFDVILPSRGDPWFLTGEYEQKKESLFGVIDQYEKIGRIYEELGITSSEDT